MERASSYIFSFYGFVIHIFCEILPLDLRGVLCSSIDRSSKSFYRKSFVIVVIHGHFSGLDKELEPISSKLQFFFYVHVIVHALNVQRAIQVNFLTRYNIFLHWISVHWVGFQRWGSGSQVPQIANPQICGLNLLTIYYLLFADQLFLRN
jgi:hypothetical protein